MFPSFLLWLAGPSRGPAGLYSLPHSNARSGAPRASCNARSARWVEYPACSGLCTTKHGHPPCALAHSTSRPCISSLPVCQLRTNASVFTNRRAASRHPCISCSGFFHREQRISLLGTSKLGSSHILITMHQWSRIDPQSRAERASRSFSASTPLQQQLPTFAVPKCQACRHIRGTRGPHRPRSPTSPSLSISHPTMQHYLTTSSPASPHPSSRFLVPRNTPTTHHRNKGGTRTPLLLAATT